MKSNNFDHVKHCISGISVMTLMILLVWSCNEDTGTEEVATNISIDTRFVNNDSITTLNTIIAELTDEVTTLTSEIAEQQNVLDSLNNLITGNPNSDSLAIWQEQVTKTESNQSTNQTALTAARSQSSEFSSRRDSLDDGFSFLRSVTNLAAGGVDQVDSLLTDYTLPLDFNITEVTYRIVVGDTTADIKLSYSLVEEIDIEGRVSLFLDTLEVKENTFDSLTLTDEGIYIFYY